MLRPWPTDDPRYGDLFAIVFEDAIARRYENTTKAILRPLDCRQHRNPDALRKPGRIPKALLPLGVVVLNTALAQSFLVPKSLEFSPPAEFLITVSLVGVAFPAPVRHLRVVARR